MSFLTIFCILCLIPPVLFYFLIDYITKKMNFKPIPPKENAAVFITGCSSGIGKCMVEEFVAKGIKVFAMVRKKKDSDTLSEISDLVYPLMADVRNTNEMEAASAILEKELSEQNLKLVSVIANAGVMRKNPSVDDINLKDMEMLVDVNVHGVMRTIKFFAPLLCEGGRMFVSGSYFGSFTFGRMAGYSGTKYFLEGYCDDVRKQLQLNKDSRSMTLLKIGNIKTDMNPDHGEVGPEAVFKTVWDSLWSQYPPARVYSGTIGSQSTYVVCTLFSLLPTALYDAITNSMPVNSHGGGV